MQQNNQIIFLTKFYFPHVGGVEKHVQKVAGSLSKKNFDVIIITEQYEKSLPLFDNKDGIKIIRIPFKKNNYFKKFYIWKWFITNFSLLSKSKLVHVHDVFYWLLPVRFFLKKEKLFITFHGYEGFPFKMKWRILRKIYEKLSQGNICVGDFMKKWYGTKPNYVIYGACDKENVKEKEVKNSIVFFGRLDGQTNILEYARSFKLLKKNNSSWKFTVYGEGKYKKNLKKPIKVYPFQGQISEKIDRFEYVFVSRYLSMLEAMISKKLVFAYYDNEIKKDYLFNSPFKKYVVISSSPEDLAKKVEYFTNNEKKKEELIKKAYDFAQKQTWEGIVKTYLDLWKPCL